MITWVIKLAGSKEWKILPQYFQRRICERVKIRWGVDAVALEPDGDRKRIGIITTHWFKELNGAEIKQVDIDDLVLAIHRKQKIRFSVSIRNLQTTDIPSPSAQELSGKARGRYRPAN